MPIRYRTRDVRDIQDYIRSIVFFFFFARFDNCNKSNYTVLFYFFFFLTETERETN